MIGGTSQLPTNTSGLLKRQTPLEPILWQNVRGCALGPPTATCSELPGPGPFHRYAPRPGMSSSARPCASSTTQGLACFRRSTRTSRISSSKACLCRSTRTSRPISLAKEVPPRRERDLILLPHVLSYLGTPRQAWNEVQPIATPGAGTSSRVSRLAEPTSQA